MAIQQADLVSSKRTIGWRHAAHRIHSICAKLAREALDRFRSQQTEIAACRHGLSSDDRSGHYVLQTILLGPKCKELAWTLFALLHTKQRGVGTNGALDVCDAKDDVTEPEDLHANAPLSCLGGLTSL